jgi:hypothetical protein
MSKYIVFKHRSTYVIFQLARKPTERMNRVSRGLTVTGYVNNYRQNWLQQVKRIDKARIPKQMFRYAPTGR